MEIKKCPDCKEVKEIHNFNKDKSTKDGFNCYCKKCLREYSQKMKQTKIPDIEIIDGEIWRDIKDYDGLYQISNFIRIKRLTRMVKSSYGSMAEKKEKILRQQKSNNGYIGVSLEKNNKSRFCSVHRLVAKTFISNTENKPDVNHIDGNKHNNNISNLEWVTKSENTIHSIRVLKNNNPFILNESKRKECIQISLDGFLLNIFESQLEAQRQTGISNISGCVNGRYKTAGGYIWM